MVMSGAKYVNGIGFVWRTASVSTKCHDAPRHRFGAQRIAQHDVVPQIAAA